ncbi:putative electron transfer flavoprotein FixA [Parvibacter caecicola]|uniref:Electron transfer flavoprotein small subunit n=1 Tax=Parvibacter caecicola TaxID=747645 RepID=A0A4T9T6Z1_9ACTN|nr:putative electron transfer flavoprotein FixA [Parvibacter caecicola]TJW09937.1 putative electron transfer flavoprotein FixA [Parvibacter caecicola]
MKIVACYKLVPEEQDLVVNADSTLDFSSAPWKVGDYDLTAIEMAMRFGESAEGAEVVLLTYGDDIVTDQKLKKGVYARGPQMGYAVKDAAAQGSDPYQTASVLAAAIRKIGDVDLVVCGEGSGDVYSQQVGPILGAMLNVSVVNAVKKGSLGDGAITVKRDLEDRVEVTQMPLPAVVSTTSEACRPRIAGMKDILAAGKKEQVVWAIDDLPEAPAASSKVVVSTLAPLKKERACTVFEGVDSIGEFVEALRKAM